VQPMLITESANRPPRVQACENLIYTASVHSLVYMHARQLSFYTSMCTSQAVATKQPMTPTSPQARNLALADR